MTDEETKRERPGRTVVTVALGFVAAAILINSWTYVTNGQAPYGDDNSAHLALLNHIAELWRAGTFELWWDQSNLGLPLFLAYQPLPALVGGTLGSAFSEFSARLAIFKGSIVILWALMPAAWYLGARWMGLARGEALIAGLLTLAVRDVHHVGFSFASVTYGGLYTQTWGMFFLPATVGAFRRYVVDRDLQLIAPVALFVVVSLSHLWCGMFAGVATLIWLLVSSRDRKERVVRALSVYVPALMLLAFWLGPMIATDHLIGGLPWKSEYYDGWPVAELFRHVLGGDIFDEGRLPWLSLSAVVGVVVVVQRRGRLVHRWLLGALVVSLLLFMGRTNFGALYDLIPMHAHINVMRYINAVQFCGIMAAAVGLWRVICWVWSRVRQLGAGGPAEVAQNRPRRASAEGCDPQEGARGVCGVSGDEDPPQTAPAEGCDPQEGARGGLEGQKWAVWGGVVGMALTVAFSVDRAHVFGESLRTFDQYDADFHALVDYLQPSAQGTRIPSRIVVSEALNTAPHIYRDLLPTLAGRGQVQSYALGYHATLSTYYADYTRYDARWARLFGAEYFVSRDPHRESMLGNFDRLFSQGRFTVWRPSGLERSGYFDFVTTPTEVHGGLREVRPAVRRVLVSGFGARALPVLTGPTEISADAGAPVLVTEDGSNVVWREEDPNAWPDALEAAGPESIGSTVIASRSGPNWYEADVDAAGGERLLLKVNYFPFWTADIDGERVEIDHVAPNFMAVDVPAGEHSVRFAYRNPWWQKLGALLCLVVLIGWGGWASRRENRG
ncbi:MAG: YfhO family protein [Myxococcota bacterium]